MSKWSVMNNRLVWKVGRRTKIKIRDRIFTKATKQFDFLFSLISHRMDEPTLILKYFLFDSLRNSIDSICSLFSSIVIVVCVVRCTGKYLNEF